MDKKMLEILFINEDHTDVRAKVDDPIEEQDEMAKRIHHLPKFCLPNGPPPVWNNLEDQLREHLENIESLPIHDFRSQQRYVARTVDATDMVKISSMPATHELAVERDIMTGSVMGFTEKPIMDPSGSATTSVSLLRAPGELGASSLKGFSSNLPFWPGGMEPPTDTEIPDTTADDLSKLRSIAPGLSRGLKSGSTTASSVSSPSNALTVTELFSAGSLYCFDSSDEDEELGSPDTDTIQAPAVEKVDMALDGGNEDDSSVEELTKDANRVLRLTEMKSIKSEPKNTEYAIKLDVTKFISDFHQRVPVMAYKWPFELDIFQKQAVLCLEKHENTFVAAHTSAGKTVVAEYAIALCRKHMTRAIYTSPIKALSNQKFRDFKLTFGDVGLITGDIQLNPEASCLIMTTEILRSMLYGGSDVIRDVEWVIFDEVHYINDRERGVVWEEVLIMLPDHVSIILLSATVPNFMSFADWVGRTKKRKVYVISTTRRPVPLEHFLYTGNSSKTSDQLFLLVNSESKLQDTGYKRAVAAKKERESAKSKTTGPKGHRTGGAPGQDKNVWLSVIEMLRKKEKLPAVAFTFSKKKIEENTGFLTSVDLTSSTEKSKIHVFIKQSINRLKGTDKELPQVMYISDLLKRGIGIHHSGVLPILKEIVELLFQQGLIKMLFATETFAMGVNMPARTVVFDSIRKHDGTQFRNLKPAEYIQMAGRAGRRGLDTTGTVIILCKGDVPELSDLNQMMLGRMTILESQFRLTYTMMLKLLRVEKLRIQDMLKRSFSEFDSRRSEAEQRSELHALRHQVHDLKPIDCYFCSQDIEKYYAMCKKYVTLKRELQALVVTHPSCVKFLSAGRVILLKADEHISPAVILTTNNRSPRTYKCLVATDKTEGWWKNHIKLEADRVYPHSMNGISQGPAGAHVLLEIDPSDIHLISNLALKIPVAPEKLIDNYDKRKIPRFKDDPPSPSILTVLSELSSLPAESLVSIDPVREFNLRDVHLRDKYVILSQLQTTLDQSICTQCNSFSEHFASISVDMELRDKFDDLTYKLSDASLHLLPEYRERLRVLRQLKYIDDMDVVQLKGKVACEISQQELLVTELIFENVTAGMHYTEIAALLSCVVFEQKYCSEPNLIPSLKEGVMKIKRIAEFLGQVQKEHLKEFVAADYVSEFKFGLVEVVYEWAQGMPFNEIIKLTDVQEGIIVRCIQRLDELIRNVKDAAKIIGDPILSTKMEEASSAIKRDIVFAASLYTQ